MSPFRRPHVPGCIPPELRRTVGESQSNDIYFNDVLEGDVLTYLEGDVANYFENPGVPSSGSSDIRTVIQPPPVRFQLTGDMTDSAGTWTATARLISYSGGFSVTGSVFTVTDLYNAFHLALSGDRGGLAFDEQANVYYPLWMNTPPTRTGVLQADLESTTLASPSGPQNVTVSGKNFPVYGVLIPETRKIEAGSTTYVTFVYDKVSNKFFAISTNVCTVPA